MYDFLESNEYRITKLILVFQEKQNKNCKDFFFKKKYAII